MVPLALPGLTAPAVAGRGLSEGLGRIAQHRRLLAVAATSNRWPRKEILSYLAEKLLRSQSMLVLSDEMTIVAKYS
jgi:hypothetical protein